MKNNSWFIYIIQCGDSTLYTGISTDVQRRFTEHDGSPKGAKYLRGKQPLTLKFSCEVGTKSEASKMEYRVKRLSREQKLKLIAGERELPSIT